MMLYCRCCPTDLNIHGAHQVRIFVHEKVAAALGAKVAQKLSCYFDILYLGGSA